MKKCIYCENNQSSEHFLCEACGVGMCDECYDNLVEHTGHYHEICELTSDKLCKKIIKELGYEPAYLCEKCLNKISNQN